MFELLSRITEVLQGLLGSPWLWLVVLAVAALDALLPFMPSETTVITVAVLIGPDLPMLCALAATAAIGALAGDCLSHGIGRRAGPAVLARLQRDARGQARYAWARRQVDRNGALLIVAGRYLPGGRVASGLATGSMGVCWARFVTLDLLGTVLWSVYSVIIGCIGGASFADEPAKGLLLSFGIGLLLVGSIEVARRLRSRYGTQPVPVLDPGAVRGPADGGACGRSGRARAHLSEVDR
ncbi:VTT domain-containing protein [Amycolatopsis cynarae]|uniref:VTT domain-containing protein n=1 Tax=Amycolatopsis cynarae TaxID=2995223 RepID=A0ABY7AZ30_9PSEU|nr:VTT domain-containing protein [Amycolatopsis sp. HUAS 11-8]WAL65282.1 VTT domain-containing protein [Amycolatopsis sp. HUAS 11-8]